MLLVLLPLLFSHGLSWVPVTAAATASLEAGQVDAANASDGCSPTPPGYVFLQGLDHDEDNFDCWHFRNEGFPFSTTYQAGACDASPLCKGFTVNSVGSCLKLTNGGLVPRWHQVPCFGFYLKTEFAAPPWPSMPPASPPAPPNSPGQACPQFAGFTLHLHATAVSVNWYVDTLPGDLAAAAAACDILSVDGYNYCHGFDADSNLGRTFVGVAPDASLTGCQGLYLRGRYDTSGAAPGVPPDAPTSAADRPSLVPGVILPLPLPSPRPPSAVSPQPPFPAPPRSMLGAASTVNGNAAFPAWAIGVVCGGGALLLGLLAALAATLWLRRRAHRKRDAEQDAEDKQDVPGTTPGGPASPHSPLGLGDAACANGWPQRPCAAVAAGTAAAKTCSQTHSPSASVSNSSELHTPADESCTSLMLVDGGGCGASFPGPPRPVSGDCMLWSASQGGDSFSIAGGRATTMLQAMHVMAPAVGGLNPESSSGERLDDANVLELQASLATQGHLLKDEHLEVFEILGQGGSGTVRRALWKGLPVAAKMMIVHQDSEEKARRQMLEATMSTGLSHPNVVTTYLFDLKSFDSILAAQQQRDHGRPSSFRKNSVLSKAWQLVILQELCTGGTLRQLMDGGELSLKDGSRLGPDVGLVHVLQLALDIASGLEHLHSKDIVHSDLTPNNVLLQGAASTQRRLGGLRWVAKVADFGLSVDLRDGRTHASHMYAGTPHYIAPETQAEGIISKQSDMFTFGLLLYEMAGGLRQVQLPQQPSHHRHPLHQLPRPPAPDLSSRRDGASGRRHDAVKGWDTKHSGDAGGVDVTHSWQDDMSSARGTVLDGRDDLRSLVRMGNDVPLIPPASWWQGSFSGASAESPSQTTSSTPLPAPAGETAASAGASAGGTDAAIGAAAGSTTTKPPRVPAGGTSSLPFVAAGGARLQPVSASQTRMPATLLGGPGVTASVPSAAGTDSGSSDRSTHHVRPAGGGCSGERITPASGGSRAHRLPTPANPQCEITPYLSTEDATQPPLSCLLPPPSSSYESRSICLGTPPDGGSSLQLPLAMLPPMPPACPAEYVALVRECLSPAPKKRPTVAAVRECLLQLLVVAATGASRGSSTASWAVGAGGGAGGGDEAGGVEGEGGGEAAYGSRRVFVGRALEIVTEPDVRGDRDDDGADLRHCPPMSYS